MEEQKQAPPPHSEKVDIIQSYIKTNIPFLRLYHTIVSLKPSLLDERKGLKASLLIFHGFNEDSSDYLPLVTHLAVEGTFECHLLDFRGFGYSTGVREHVDLVELQNDILILITEVLKRNLSRNITLPVFIVANSYAANVVAGLLINNPGLPLAGVIMCSPAFSTHYQYSQLSIFEKIHYLYIYPLIQVKSKCKGIESEGNAVCGSRGSYKR